MKGTTCLLSSSTALGRAVSGRAPRSAGMTTAACSSSFSTLTASESASLLPAQSRTRRMCPSYITSRVQCRSLHSSSPLGRRVVPPLLPWQLSMMDKKGVKDRSGAKSAPSITHEYVILRQEDGSLSEPLRTSDLLRKLGADQSLTVLAPPSTKSTGNIEQDLQQRQYPICRITNIMDERKAEQTKAKEQRKKATMFKELEFNWSINPHDLGHWMLKLKDFLEKGFRVEVRMMRRTRGKARRQATMEEANELVRIVRETVGSVPGAREVKGMEGELLGSAKMIYEGPAVSSKDKDKAKKKKAAELDAVPEEAEI